MENQQQPQLTQDERKARFLEALAKSLGIITVAAEASGVNRRTVHRWKTTDPNFAAELDDIMERQVDFVESSLLTLIREGDTAATIFYLKTKGKKRGYTEKPLPPQDAASATSPAPAGPHLVPGDTARRITHKKTYFTRLLKEQGKYTPELAVQVKMAAELSIRVETLAEEIFAEGHKPVTVEYSREGNSRERISEKERLYLDYCTKMQSALKAIGMTADAKERRTDGKDDLQEFLQSIEGGI